MNLEVLNYRVQVVQMYCHLVLNLINETELVQCTTALATMVQMFRNLINNFDEVSEVHMNYLEKWSDYKNSSLDIFRNY